MRELVSGLLTIQGCVIDSLATGVIIPESPAALGTAKDDMYLYEALLLPGASSIVSNIIELLNCCISLVPTPNPLSLSTVACRDVEHIEPLRLLKRTNRILYRCY